MLSDPIPLLILLFLFVPGAVLYELLNRWITGKWVGTASMTALPVGAILLSWALWNLTGVSLEYACTHKVQFNSMMDPCEISLFKKSFFEMMEAAATVSVDINEMLLSGVLLPAIVAIPAFAVILSSFLLAKTVFRIQLPSLIWRLRWVVDNVFRSTVKRRFVTGKFIVIDYVFAFVPYGCAMALILPMFAVAVAVHWIWMKIVHSAFRLIYSNEPPIMIDLRSAKLLGYDVFAKVLTDTSHFGVVSSIVTGENHSIVELHLQEHTRESPVSTKKVILRGSAIKELESYTSWTLLQKRHGFWNITSDEELQNCLFILSRMIDYIKPIYSYCFMFPKVEPQLVLPFWDEYLLLLYNKYRHPFWTPALRFQLADLAPQLRNDLKLSKTFPHKIPASKVIEAFSSVKDYLKWGEEKLYY